MTVRVDRVIGRGDAEAFIELEGNGGDAYYVAYVDGAPQMPRSADGQFVADARSAHDAVFAERLPAYRGHRRNQT